MSQHECPVVRISRVEKHPNADRLEVLYMSGMDFPIIAQSGLHAVGEIGAYIPEGSVLPEPLIEKMGLDGMLAGSGKNRVKAIKLRGELSRGLFYPFTDENLCGNGVIEGDNVADSLGVIKWEPYVPPQLQGIARARPVGPSRDFWHHYDLESISRYPDIFEIGEPISITEKLHGTLLFCAIIDGEEVISSKGLAARNLIIERDEANTYWRAALENDLFTKLRKITAGSLCKNAILFGEIIGVQDLKYGLSGGKNTFHAFDLYQHGFCYPKYFRSLCAWQSIPTVPLLYEGPFDPAVVAAHTNGQSTLANHIREGVVIKPEYERTHPKIGRVALKSVSEAYLLRKGEATEWN